MIKQRKYTITLIALLLIILSGCTCTGSLKKTRYLRGIKVQLKPVLLNLFRR